MPEKSPERTRLWESHPIAIAVTIVSLLFLVGGFIVLRRAGRTPTSESVTWSVGTGAFQNPTASAPVYTDNTSPTPSAVSPTPETIQLPPATAPQTTPASTDTSFQSFLTGLTGSSVSGGATASNKTTLTPDTLSAFSYLPQGLIRTSLDKPRTPEQTALHTYGNAAGSLIKRFESGHPEMVATLEAFTKDRTNAQGAAGMRALAADLTAIGTDMEKMGDVPEGAGVVHKALAQKYEEIGGKLALIADSSGDEAYLASINDYNAAADSFTGSYVAMMTMFSISGVTFGAYEDGNVFSYPGGGGF